MVLEQVILKKAGIVKSRRDATKNYYYVDANEECMDNLLKFVEHVKLFMNILPDRKGEEQEENMIFYFNSTQYKKAR